MEYTGRKIVAGFVDEGDVDGMVNVTTNKSVLGRV